MTDYVIEKSEGKYNISSLHLGIDLKVRDFEASNGEKYGTTNLDFAGLVKTINNIYLTSLEKAKQDANGWEKDADLTPMFYVRNCNRDKKVLALLDCNRTFKKIFEEICSQVVRNKSKEKLLDRIEEIVKKGL